MSLTIQNDRAISKPNWTHRIDYLLGDVLGLRHGHFAFRAMVTQLCEPSWLTFQTENVK